MNEWQTTLILTAAEVKNKTNAQITRIILKESDIERAEIKDKLSRQPAKTHRSTLVVMLSQVRHRNSKEN